MGCAASKICCESFTPLGAGSLLNTSTYLTLRISISFPSIPSAYIGRGILHDACSSLALPELCFQVCMPLVSTISRETAEPKCGRCDSIIHLSIPSRCVGVLKSSLGRTDFKRGHLTKKMHAGGAANVTKRETISAAVAATFLGSCAYTGAGELHAHSNVRENKNPKALLLLYSARSNRN